MQAFPSIEAELAAVGLTPGANPERIHMTEEQAQLYLTKIYRSTRQRTEWVPVYAINTDDRYQRNLNVPRVGGLVANFIPALLGTIVVSRREDGSYWVMDGQHRVEAAKRAGLKHVLCEIWTGLTVQLEAAVFIILNVNRTAVTGVPAFKARLEAKERVAMDIRSIVEKNGAELKFSSGRMAKAGQVRAFSTLESIYHASGPNMLDAVIAFCMSAWPGDPGNLQVNVLMGVHQFMSTMAGEYDPIRLLEALRVVEPMKIIRAGMSARQMQGGDLAIHTATDMVRLYNLKLRGNARLDPLRLRIRKRLLSNHPDTRAANRSAVVEMADLLRREAQRINRG